MLRRSFALALSIVPLLVVTGACSSSDGDEPPATNVEGSVLPPEPGNLVIDGPAQVDEDGGADTIAK